MAEALHASRLVTLTGFGGTGKTRLAMQVATEVAAEFADRAVFVDLSPVRDPGLIAAAIAGACGLADGARREPEELLLGALRDRDLLLVLDNLEQLVEGVAVLGRLLAACAQVRILATSRVSLHLYGEYIVRVPPLNLADGSSPEGSEAVQLFVARAAAAGWDRRRDSAAMAAIVETCTALDGLPLAIELAAAQARIYSPQQLLPLLQSRLDVLRGGPRDVPGRQRTLLATLDWSYALLSPAARHLFACVGILPGRFDAAAAAAVAGAPSDIRAREPLDELIEHSLIEVETGTELPMRQFQTVSEYALARLAESGEEDATYRRGLRHYLAVAQAAMRTAGTPEYFDAEAGVEQAYPNIRAVLDFAQHQGADDQSSLADGLQLATAVARMWVHRGMLTEGLALLSRLLDLDRDRAASDAETRARALTLASALASFTGRYESSIAFAREAIELFTSRGDHAGLSRTHRYIGEAHYALGEFDLAESEFELGLEASRVSGETEAQGSALNMLGQLHRRQGQLAAAAAEIQESIDAFARIQLENGVVAATHSLAEVRRDAGEVPAAAVLFAEALRRAVEITDRRCIAYDLEGLATIEQLEGDPRQALVLIGAAAVLRVRIGAQLQPIEQAEVAESIERASAGMTSAERDAALADGRSAPLDEVIARALGNAARVRATMRHR